VTASGPGGGTSAVQAGSGFYSINVTSGDYLVTPSGVPAGAGDAQYKPRNARVSVPPDGAASADFSLDAGLKVTLKLSQASVPADGMTVAKGTLTTKEYGKPVPNVGFLLEPKPALGYEAAVTTGTRVAICNSYGGRIWPTGPGGGAALLTPQGRQRPAPATEPRSVPGQATAWVPAQSNLAVTRSRPGGPAGAGRPGTEVSPSLIWLS
jgi:hypothetical protein